VDLIAAAAANPSDARSAITIAWIGAAGTVLAAFMAVIVAVVQTLLKKSTDPTANFIDQLQEQLKWEHDERLKIEKERDELRAQLSTQLQMNDALMRRINKAENK
jgi:regulator of sigma D